MLEVTSIGAKVMMVPMIATRHDEFDGYEKVNDESSLT